MQKNTGHSWSLPTCTYTGILFSIRKEGNSDRICKTDQFSGYFSMWNKPLQKVNTLYDMRYLEWLYS